MSIAVKIFKTVLILALIAAVVLVFWFGIMGATAKVEVPIAEPSGLGIYPSDLVAEIEAGSWKPNFSLEDFLLSDFEGYSWGSSEKTFFWGPFGSANNGVESYEGSKDKINSDAINLIRLADYNESGIPFFSYYTDAGGSADIAGSIKGNLMSQTVHVQEGVNWFHQHINAIVQDPDTPMNPALVTTAEGILNKAKRELVYNGDYYFLQGAFPKYLFGEDYVDDNGQVVLVNGQPTVFEDGRCTANWDASVQKSKNENKTLPSMSEDEAFPLKYTNKFILNLNPSSYTKYSKYAPTTWFDPEKTKIDKIYVDEQGKDAGEVTDRYYIKVVLEADLPARPEKDSEIKSWAEKCKEANINQVLGIENPAYSEKTKDFTPQYLNDLPGYTGAYPVHFTALKFTYEIWDCGVIKSWRTDEGWYGTLVAFTGDVQPFNPTYYSYSKDYCKVGDFLTLAKAA